MVMVYIKPKKNHFLSLSLSLCVCVKSDEDSGRVERRWDTWLSPLMCQRSSNRLEGRRKSIPANLPPLNPPLTPLP